MRNLPEHTAIRRILCLWLFPALILCGLCALDSEDAFGAEKIRAEGVGFFSSGREAVGREKALDEAKRAAVEKAVGVTIESMSEVRDFAVVADRIISRSSGYIRSYEVVSEKKLDDATYEVVIEAEVSTASIRSDADRFTKMLSWQKNPSVSVRIPDGVSGDRLSACRKAASFLNDRLKKEGFRVYDAGAEEHMEMGLFIYPDLLLSTRTTDYQGLSLTVNEASLTVTVVRPSDREILSTSTATRSVPGENALASLEKGAREGVDAVWKDVRRDLYRLWEKEFYTNRNLVVAVEGMKGYKAAEELARVFKDDIGGVAQSRLSRFSNNTAVYDISYRGWPEQFVEELLMDWFKNAHFAMTVKRISGNRITMRKK